MGRTGDRSGRWLVVGMFGFGLSLTAGLYVYLMLHTAPFRPLAAALDERYPGSAPRVDGGKPRVDRPGEAVLRVVMRSPFDPEDEARSSSLAREVAGFVAAQPKAASFEMIEVHLYRERPERELSQRTVRLKVEEVLRSQNNGKGL